MRIECVGCGSGTDYPADHSGMGYVPQCERCRDRVSTMPERSGESIKGVGNKLWLNEYQARANKTATEPCSKLEHAVVPTKLFHGLIYVGLKLGGEAGEFAQKLGKIMRDSHWMIGDETHEALVLELGDVLWYCAQAAVELGVELNYVAEKNLEKLADRASRNRISGSGDHR